MFWVYILKCSDGSYYTGHTDNLEKRMYEHEYGAHETSYTFTRRPVKLMFHQAFQSRQEAKEAEKKIKGWNRTKKEKLITGEWGNPSTLEDSSSGFTVG